MYNIDNEEEKRKINKNTDSDQASQKPHPQLPLTKSEEIFQFDELNSPHDPAKVLLTPPKFTKKFPIGNSNFGQIARNLDKLYYIEKTGFISKVLLEEGNVKIKVFTRPKRFCKSLNLSMMYHFLADKIDDQSTEGLFDSFDISKNAELMNEHNRKYDVIYLDFKSMNHESYPQFLMLFGEKIAKLYTKFEKIKDALGPTDKVIFDKILTRDANETILINSLNYLTEFITKYNRRESQKNKKDEYKKKEMPYILIDEFDSPLVASAFSAASPYFDKAFFFLKQFLKEGLKSNDNIEGALITGIINVSGEMPLFSDLNNPKFYSITDTAYAEYFGFTLEEIKKMLKDFRLEHCYQDLISWYGHYNSAKTMIFNPWSIIHWHNNFKEKGNVYEGYWSQQGTDYATIAKLIMSGGDEFKAKIIETVENGTIETVRELCISLSIQKINKTAPLLNLLLSCGYLTPLSLSAGISEGKVTLMIPNKEIFLLFKNHIVPQWKPEYVDKKLSFKPRSELIEKKLNEITNENLIDLYQSMQQKESCIKFLNFCSLIDHRNIPISLLEQFAKGNKAEVGKFMSEIEEKKLLSRDILIDTFSFIHKNLAIQVRRHLQNNQKPIYQNLLTIAVECLFEIFKFDDLKIETYQSCNLIYNHVEEDLKQVFTKRHYNFDVRSPLMNKINELSICLMNFYLYIKVDCDRVLEWGKTITLFYKKTALEESEINLFLARIWSITGKAHYRLNNFIEAKVNYEKSDSLLNALTSPIVRKYKARNLIRLAKLYRIKAEYKLALEKFQQAKMVLNEISSIYQVESIDLNFQIAFMQLYLNKIGLSELVKVSVDVIEELRKLNNKVILAKNLRKYGILIVNNEEQLTSAKDSFDESLTLTHEIYEDKLWRTDDKIYYHPEVAKILINQLLIYHLYKDYDKKIKEAESILAFYKIRTPNLAYLNLYLNAGFAYAEQGYPFKAEQYFDKALEQMKPIFKEKPHPLYLSRIFNSLGETRRLIGKIDEAEKCYTDFRESAKNILKEQDPSSPYSANVGVAEFNLGEIALIRCDFINAKKHFQEALNNFRPFYEANHIKTFLAQHALLRTQFEEGDYTQLYNDPDTYYYDVNALLDKGCDALEIADSLHFFGQMYSSAGNISQAIRFNEAACQVIITRNEEHPFLGRYKTSLIIPYFVSGRKTESLTALNRAYVLFNKYAWNKFPDYGKLLLVAIQLKLLIGDEALIVRPAVPSTADEMGLINKSLDELIAEAEALFDHIEKNYISCQLELKVLKGKYFYFKKDHKNAIDIFKNCLTDTIHYFGTNHQRTAEIYFLISMSFYLSGDLQKSEESYSKFLLTNSYPYTNTLSDWAHVLEKDGILGYISITSIEKRISEKLSNTLNSKDSTKLITNTTLFKQYVLSTLENFYNETLTKIDKNIVSLSILASNLVSVLYVFDEFNKAQEYLNRYKQHVSQIEEDKQDNIKDNIVIDVFFISFLIPTKIDESISHYEKYLETIPAIGHFKTYKTTVYNNLACLYQLKACRDRLWGNIKYDETMYKARYYFDESLKLTNPSPTSAEFARYLFSNNKLDELHKFIFKNVEFDRFISTQRLFYGEVEKPTVPICLKKVLSYQKSITLKPQLLLYYLRSICYTQANIQKLYNMSLHQNFEEFKKFINFEPSAEGYYLLGYSYYENSMLRESKEEFLKITALYSKDNAFTGVVRAAQEMIDEIDGVEIRNSRSNSYENVSKLDSIEDKNSSILSMSLTDGMEEFDLSQKFEHIAKTNEFNEKFKNLISDKRFKIYISFNDILLKSILVKFIWEVSCNNKNQIEINIAGTKEVNISGISCNVLYQLISELKQHIISAFRSFNDGNLPLDLQVIQKVLLITSDSKPLREFIIDLISNSLLMNKVQPFKYLTPQPLIGEQSMFQPNSDQPSQQTSPPVNVGEQQTQQLIRDEESKKDQKSLSVSFMRDGLFIHDLSKLPVELRGIIKAILALDEKSVKDELKKNNNIVLEPDPNGNLPIHYAAYKGHIPIMNMIKEERCGINHKNNFKLNILQIAAFFGHVEATEWLKSEGVGNETVEIFEIKLKISETKILIEKLVCTPLQLAVLNGQIGVTRVLLKNLENPNELQVPGIGNILHLGVFSRDPWLLRELLHHPVILKSPHFLNDTDNRLKLTPLMLAGRLSNTAAVRLLSSNPHIQLFMQSERKRQTALHHAAKCPNPDVIEAMISNIGDSIKQLLTYHE